MSEEEKRRILSEFNSIQREYPKDKTIHQLFEEQAARTPDSAAVGAQGTVPFNDIYLTYRELNNKSGQLAEVLREKGIGPDTIVGIMVEPSVDMVIGILGILKAGGAYLPIDPDYPRERIDYMLKDSNAKILLSELSKVSEDFEVVGLSEFKKEILTHLTPLTHPTQLCYVIYTSGSTGKPKGTMVEHVSVVNILFALFEMFPFGETDRYLLKTSYLFDVSVTELFGWFLGGGVLVIPGKNDHKDPGKLLDAVEYSGITHINFVPSMFYAFLELLEYRPRDIRRLSSLKYIFLAGEALLSTLVDRFRRLGIPVKLENLYGPTEGTVYAGRYPLEQWESGDNQVPIGKPLPNVELYILDDAGRLLPPGVTGELVISGAGVARGYLNNPQLTAERFVSFFYRPYRSYRSYSSKKIYKTGDRAQWLPDGNILFLGRLDHQVKIRGFRVELGEIENRLLKYPGIKTAAVTAGADERGDTYLCAYIVLVNRGVDMSDLRKHLSQSLPDYMVPVYFVTLDEMPLTPTGKLDRGSLPEPEIKTRHKSSDINTYEAKTAAPGNEIERKLAEIWEKVLGIKKEIIGIDDHFFQLGGHSLKAASVLLEIHKIFSLRLSLEEVLKIPTIRKLSEHISTALKVKDEDKYQSICAAEEKEYYVLSPAQERFYFLYQIDPQHPAYNINDAYVLEGVLDIVKLEESFDRLICRHESLRTSFIALGKEMEPVQKIHREVKFDIEYNEAQGIEGFIRPFALSRPPLFRIGLFKLEEEKHVFLFDMHHIIGDAVSIEIFVNELMLAYNDRELPGLTLQYRDFSEWQRGWVMSEAMKSQEKFWLHEFRDGVPVLDIPTDYKRPEEQGFCGDNTRFEIAPQEAERLREYAREEDTTVFMVMLAVFYVLLFKLSGREDIVVGTPVVGRRYAELFDIVGVFINTIALRNYPAAGKQFNEFLHEVRRRTLEAFENQEYPFEDLVKKGWMNKNSSRNPMFDVLFTYRQEERNAFLADENAAVKVERYELQHRQSILDLVLTVLETENQQQLFFNIGYSTNLFKPETMEKFILYFKEIISAVVGNKHIPLEEIKISHDLGEAKSTVPQINFGF